MNKHPVQFRLVDGLDFNGFCQFCMDFGVVPTKMKPQDIRNVLVAMERYNLRVGGDETLNCMDFEEFVEAVFVVAMSSFTLPSSNQFNLPEIRKLYHKIEVIEGSDAEVSKSREKLPKQTISPVVQVPKQTSGAAPAKTPATEKSKPPKLPASVSTPQLVVSSKNTLPPTNTSKQNQPVRASRPKVEDVPAPVLPKSAEEGVALFRRFLEELRIPKHKRDATKMIEERRKRFVLDKPRYWDGSHSI